MYISGTKKVKINAVVYPGIKNQKREIPVRTRIMESPIASAIAMERLRLITRPGIAPALTVSICFSRTATAGSADMINQPIAMARGTSHQTLFPEESAAPSSAPRAENPMLTPVKKSTRPIYV